jgi:hypothetical protein
MKRLIILSALLSILAGASLVSARDDTPIDLYLDSAALVADDGAGYTVWLTQAGDGGLWVVAGDNEDGYTYQFLAGTGLDQASWVATTQSAGTWDQDEDDNYVFTPTGQMPNPPAAPQPVVPVGPPPPRGSVVIGPLTLQNGTQIWISYDPATGILQIDTANPDGSSETRILRPAQRPKPNPQPMP